MGHQITQLQGITSAIININVAYPIKANDFACVRIGNTSCEINLATTGINILHKYILCRGIVVHVQFVLVAAIRTTPISTTINNLILLACGDHIVANSFAIVSIINFINSSSSCSIGDIGIVITKTTLNLTIYIDIRGIDINIASCNIAASGLRAIRIGRVILFYIVLTDAFLNRLKILFIVL